MSTTFLEVVGFAVKNNSYYLAVRRLKKDGVKSNVLNFRNAVVYHFFESEWSS